MNLLIVESPSKAKTINKYLGSDFTVLASFGHIRDLPAKDGSVQPDNDFAMTYEVDGASQKHLQEIAKAAKDADAIFLATDPDREGEAISWHVLEALKQKKAIKKDTEVHRVVFHEVTKRAVLDAIAHPRDINMHLVNAQQARRALDYLVGFNLSPVLWRKLPGSRSAGRVQSVALRLICDREAEIEAFRSQEYWDIKVPLAANDQPLVTAKLIQWQGNKLDKFDIPNEKAAADIVSALDGQNFTVSSVTPKQVKRNPAPPFTTSTLQQEASRKLGYSAKRTMQLAQKLYEGVPIGGETTGLITYMRTDSVTLSGEAIANCRKVIDKDFGAEYVPDSPRQYTSKAKNAQEAHEAIRPTDAFRRPAQLQQYLEDDMLRLYELIWKRTMACQMASAVLDQVSVEFTEKEHNAMARATGSVIKFDGFIKLYREDRDDKSDDDDEDDSSRMLPPLAEGEVRKANDVEPHQHFTEPPPRFSEASLVKKLEELGIGRPSTYASILSVLQDRDYVRLDKKRFHPEARGRLVNAFLVSFFERYVQPDFTARLEGRLDDIASAERDWKEVLRDFWGRFHELVEETKEIPMSEVLSMLDELMENYLFPHDDDKPVSRACPSCNDGKLSLRIGRYGAYVGCSNYPECKYTRQVGDGTGEEDAAAAEGGLPKLMGTDPKTKHEVWLKKGPYGVYVQLGDDSISKPKRMSLLKHQSADTLTLEDALQLLSLPREVGEHPESGKIITASIGRYGPYLLHDGKYVSISPDELLTIGINRAVDVIAEKGKKGSSAEALRTIGEHPDGGELVIYSGRYGPYVKYGKINASLPKGTDVDAFTMEEALALLEKKKGAKSGGRKRTAKKKA